MSSVIIKYNNKIYNYCKLTYIYIYSLYELRETIAIKTKIFR